MHIRHRPETQAALLLAAMLVLHVLLGGSGSSSLLRAMQHAVPSPGSSADKELAWCRANVSIIHDVHWASACSIVAQEQRESQSSGEPADDLPDCTLPDQRALPLNMARAKADQQCLAEAVEMLRR